MPMMLDPNYRTSFDNFELLARSYTRGEALFHAFSDLFNRSADNGMTQELAVHLESRFGGNDGYEEMRGLMDSTMGLGREALQQAMLHKQNLEPETRPALSEPSKTVIIENRNSSQFSP